MILGIFDRLNVREPEGFAHIHGLIEATKHAFILRNAHLGDPERMDPDWRNWLSESRLAHQATTISYDRAGAFDDMMGMQA